MKDVNLCRTLMLTACIAVFVNTMVFGQMLNKPEPAPNANIGATTPWTAACASADFNGVLCEFLLGVHH